MLNTTQSSGLFPSSSHSLCFCQPLLCPGSSGHWREAVLARSAWARRLFHPARCSPSHGQLRAHPGWNCPRNPEGFWGLCAAQQPCQPPAGMEPLPRSSHGRAPGRSPGKRPPLPGGHLRPGSSPSSAFPGGFRLPSFLRLPGARTFVPARGSRRLPRSRRERRRWSTGGCPAGPAALPGAGKRPQSLLRLLPAHLRRPFSAQIRHQFSFWIISSSKKSSPKNIKHRPTGGKRAPSGTGTRPPPAPQPGKLQPRSRSGPLFLVRLNSLLPRGSFRNISQHWGGGRGGPRRGAPNPPAPRSAGLGGGQAARAAAEPSRCRPSRGTLPQRPGRRQTVPGTGTAPAEPGRAGAGGAARPRLAGGSRRRPGAPGTGRAGACHAAPGSAAPAAGQSGPPVPPADPAPAQPHRGHRGAAPEPPAAGAPGRSPHRPPGRARRAPRRPSCAPSRSRAAPRPGPAAHMARNGAGPAGR